MIPQQGNLIFINYLKHVGLVMFGQTAYISPWAKQQSVVLCTTRSLAIGSGRQNWSLQGSTLHFKQSGYIQGIYNRGIGKEKSVDTT